MNESEIDLVLDPIVDQEFYEWLLTTRPELVTAIVDLLRRGYSPDHIHRSYAKKTGYERLPFIVKRVAKFLKSQLEDGAEI